MGRRSRRSFLRGSLALAGLGVLAGCGRTGPPVQQPRKSARIGYLSQAGGPAPPGLGSFREGLQQLGYVEGQDVTIELRSAEGDAERLPALAAELVRLPVDVIVTGGGTPAALAAKHATATIPIVALAVGDPVGSGLVASIARPGGNVTAMTNFSPEVSAKRLELLKEVVPGALRLAYFWNPANPASHPDWSETQVAADTLRLGLRSVEARSPDDVDGGLAAIAGDRPDALVVSGDIVFVERRQQVIDFAATSRLPTMYSWGLFVPPGGLMAYGVDPNDVYRRGAVPVDKILKGANPADLPVEQPARFDFRVNLKTAQALGLTIPQSVLLQATEIVQ